LKCTLIADVDKSAQLTIWYKAIQLVVINVIFVVGNQVVIELILRPA